jgi:hypothetical protein
MFKVSKMRVCDYTCLLCGSKLGLTMESACVGDNRGCCPMCSEPFVVNITDHEMRDFRAIEEELASVRKPR